MMMVTMLLMITMVMMMVIDGDDEVGDSGDDHDGTVMMMAMTGPISCRHDLLYKASSTNLQCKVLKPTA